ncbi:TPA: branched-chain amino acid ABC transporter permease [Candidatus Woesearchaeota archaeon]|nr:branched-chain amino acid ABC transporter permease [Candidatus Woesearchaeota archaeon]
MAYIEHFLIMVCLYITLAVSLNLVIGYTGLLLLGFITFNAVGAYAAALVTLPAPVGLGMSFLVGVIASASLAAFFGFLIGLPTLKLKGDYFAVASLGLFYVTLSLLKNWSSLTRGPLGLPGIPKPSLFGYVFSTQYDILALAVILMAITIFVVYRITKSPFGRVLTAIREDELGVKAFGKNPVKYKIIALMISAAIAGMAGSLYAGYITFIDPNTFTFTDSIFVICMVVLGGLGSIRGSIAGVLIFSLLTEGIRFLNLPNETVGALRLMIFSVLLILLMQFKPLGILGEKRLRVKEID